MRLTNGFSGVVIVLGLLGAGCPPSGGDGTGAQKKAAPISSACSKVGQSCEVSAGKLGTCVQKDDCKDPAGCFDCQSQH